MLILVKHKLYLCFSRCYSQTLDTEPVTMLNGLTLSESGCTCHDGILIKRHRVVCEYELLAITWHFVNTILAFHLTSETGGSFCCCSLVNGLFVLQFSPEDICIMYIINDFNYINVLTFTSCYFSYSSKRKEMNTNEINH